MRYYFVYILTNRPNGTLYVGVTNDLVRRIVEHRSGRIEGFTKTYQLHRLVYYEIFHHIEEAIAREKQIKGGSRANKQKLINSINPLFKDLFEEISRW